MDTTSDSMLRTNFHQNGIGMAENVLFFFQLSPVPKWKQPPGPFLGNPNTRNQLVCYLGGGNGNSEEVQEVPHLVSPRALIMSEHCGKK